MVKQQIADLLENEQLVISKYGHLKEIENSMGCVDGKIIGTGRLDYTKGSTDYNLTIGSKTFALIDIPGIEGDETQYEEIIRNSLDRAHAIFYVNGSGKKIEKATLEKIKKYMRDGTSVYAIFNVHCKAKKERIPGIDKTFSEELAAAYQKQDEIIKQTEVELCSFLGENYKGNISINGLLSFCGLAVNASGHTTIVDEKDKNLRSDQHKYLREYSFEPNLLVKEGHIKKVQDIIVDKIENLDSYIYNENIKKLKSRLSTMCAKIDTLKKEEASKIEGFIKTYDEFQSNCNNAKEDYIQELHHVGYNAASDAFEDVKSDLFEMVERDRGKTKSSDIQHYFESHKDKIVSDIQDKINGKMAQIQTEYESAIADAQERLLKDFEREQAKFEISLSSENLSLGDALGDALRYSWKTFGGDVFRVGSLSISGALVGSAFLPGIGTVIGAAIGFFAGILNSVWSFFTSEAKRINKAKGKVERAVDEQIDAVSENIKSQLSQLNYEEVIEAHYKTIYDRAETQKSALRTIEKTLTVVCNNLEKSKHNLV